MPKEARAVISHLMSTQRLFSALARPGSGVFETSLIDHSLLGGTYTGPAGDATPTHADADLDPSRVSA